MGLLFQHGTCIALIIIIGILLLIPTNLVYEAFIVLYNGPYYQGITKTVISTFIRCNLYQKLFLTHLFICF